MPRILYRPQNPVDSVSRAGALHMLVDYDDPVLVSSEQVYELGRIQVLQLVADSAGPEPCVCVQKKIAIDGYLFKVPPAAGGKRVFVPDSLVRAYPQQSFIQPVVLRTPVLAIAQHPVDHEVRQELCLLQPFEDGSFPVVKGIRKML
jgi:hypothetical protein